MESLTLSEISPLDSSVFTPPQSPATSIIIGQTSTDKANASALSFANFVKTTPIKQPITHTTRSNYADSLASPSHLHMSGTEIELMEAKERAKSLQLGVRGTANLTSFLSAEKVVLLKYRRKQFEHSE